MVRSARGVSRSTSDLTELAIINSTLPPMTRMLCFKSFNSRSNAVLMCSRSIMSPYPAQPESNVHYQRQSNAEDADVTDKSGLNVLSVENPFFPAFSDVIRVPCLVVFIRTCR